MRSCVWRSWLTTALFRTFLAHCANCTTHAHTDTRFMVSGHCLANELVALPLRSSALRVVLWTSYTQARRTFNVETVSSKQSALGLTVAMMLVWLLPPSESLSRKVNFESRYRMCVVFLLETASSVRITAPSVVNDLLIMLASFNVAPAASVRCAIRCTVPGLVCALSLSQRVPFTRIEKWQTF